MRPLLLRPALASFAVALLGAAPALPVRAEVKGAGGPTAGSAAPEVQPERAAGAEAKGTLHAVQNPSPPDPEPQPPPAAAVEELRDRARTILAEVQALTLPLAEARVLVERLLRDLHATGEEEGWTPTRRRLEIHLPGTDRFGFRIEEECPLFYEEELIQLCPLDLSRSEIWGSQVLVCGFACAPEGSDPFEPGGASR